jgi:hypothetical protein
MERGLIPFQNVWNGVGMGLEFWNGEDENRVTVPNRSISFQRLWNEKE